MSSKTFITPSVLPPFRIRKESRAGGGGTFDGGLAQSGGLDGQLIGLPADGARAGLLNNTYNETFLYDLPHGTHRRSPSGFVYFDR